MDLGAKSVRAAATHAVLSGPAIDRIKESQIQEMVFLNTIPVTDEKKLDKIKVLSVGKFFAEVISRVHTNTPVSEMFE